MAASSQKSSPVKVLTAALLLIFIVTLGTLSASVSGAQLLVRSITLTSAEINVTTTYKLGFRITTPGTLGSIQAQFCSNNPLFTEPCDQPAGLDVSGAVLGAQIGETGFSVSNASTANNLILIRPPSASSVQFSSYSLDNIVNPSATGSYYVRVQTFASNDASGASTDYGGLAFNINDNFRISAEVPPYILFCAGLTIPSYDCGSSSGKTVDLGNLSSKKTSSGQSQLLVATNAANGYTIYMQGTTLTSGNDVISSLTLPGVALAGSNQFGVNLRANLSPAVGSDPVGPGSGLPAPSYNQPDKFAFNSGDAIASAPQGEDYRRYTISYVADVSGAQPPGIYVSTITYVAVGNF
jgi:hypothetical protein